MKRVVFLLGAPRSGTTWLQSLLGAHPDVVTPQETDVFDRYVAPLDQGWQWQMRGGPVGWAQRRYKGLPAVITRERFDELLGEFVTSILEAVAALKPGATVLVEKSPSHSLHTELVSRLLPDAHYLHLIRDGRDVASSLLAASEGWGASWAPRSVRGAAEMWASHVDAARTARSRGAVYREVRYEELRSGGAEVLPELFAFCGITTTAEECRELLERMSLDRMSKPEGGSVVVTGGELTKLGQARTEPPGFFGGGNAGGWRQTWSARERRVFAAVAGDLLLELGYATDGSWVDQGVVASRATDIAALGARAFSSALRRASRRADRWTDRLP